MTKKLASKIEKEKNIKDFIHDMGYSIRDLAKLMDMPYGTLRDAFKRGLTDLEVQKIEQIFHDKGLALLSYRVPESERYWNKKA